MKDQLLTPATTPEPAPAPTDQSSKPSKLWWVWVIFVAVVGLAAFFFYRQHQSTQEQQAKGKAGRGAGAVPVVTGTVRAGNIGVYVEALGTVTPIYTVSITSRVQGQIVKVYYHEGQMVRKGSPLLDIDPRPYQASLTQTEGQLARDQAALNGARIDLDRYRTALQRNAIAQQQVYDQEQLVKQDEGTVTNDEGSVENARVNLAYCHISSPIEGRVGLRLVDLGNLVQANSTTPLVVVTQLQPITVIFSVAEDYLPQIQRQLRTGRKMSVDALDRTEQQVLASGFLSSLDNQIDTTTGTIKLRATFPNRDGNLFPNQFVNSKLLLDTQQGVTLVPTQAIQRNGQGAFVYVIQPPSSAGKAGGKSKDGEKSAPEKTPQGGAASGQKADTGGKIDGIAVMQTITVGVTDGNDTAVQGVEPGEVIAVDGFDKLQDGAKVIRKEATNPGSPAAGRSQKGSTNAASSGVQTQ